MEIEILDGSFSVCKVKNFPPEILSEELCFIGRTDDENSLVCKSGSVPESALCREDGFCGMRVKGVLDFSLVGILAKISSILAENGISIFAVSTFNTDYIFVREENLSAAKAALSASGYKFV